MRSIAWSKTGLIRWLVVAAILLALILIPFALFDQPLAAWILAQLREHPARGFAIIVLALASDVFLPIPSSVVSTLAGTLLGFTKGLAASWLGMTLGSLAGYWFGATAGRAAAVKAVGEREFERAARWQEKYGDWALIVSRPVPVLAEASVIAAGFSRMRFPRFCLLTALANLGISAAYVGFGGESFPLAFAGAIGLPLVAMRLAGGWTRRA